MNFADYSLSVDICEMAILIIGLMSVLILFYIVASVADFHLNFRVLLLMLLSIFLMALVDFFFLLVIEDLALPPCSRIVVMNVLVIIHDVIMPCYTSTFILLVAERFIATRCAYFYEKCDYRGPVLLGLAFALSIAFGTALSLYFNLSDQRPARTAVALSILTAIDMLSFLMILYLLYRNKRLLRVKFLQGMHNLSERYQLTENIKITRLLAPVLISNVVVSLINVMTVAYYLLVLPYDPQRDVRIVGYIVDWSTTIFTTVTPWMILLRHPPYLRKFRSMLGYKAAEVTCAGPSHITNINGENISRQEEVVMHFKILSRSWL